ncbi:MAG: IS200/IS605 family element transposase accessory protein TnpB [Candidatus Methanomethyliales bacterium]|nr:IS200/IS605 family element transposase accessory protein TnpB [Candidatus Methanomethylicales archaeon]
MLSETCRFKLEPNEEQRLILEELVRSYQEIVKECLDIALKLGITSRKRMHENIYRRLRTKYSNHPSHYIYTAITQALGIFKSYRRLLRKRNDIKPPEAKNVKSILLDDTHLFWFYWGKLRLATHKGHIEVPFEVHEYAEKFKDWEVKGSRLVRLGGEYYLHVTFRKTVKENTPEGLLGIDVNERSIDLAIVKPDKVKFIKIDISEAKYIRDRYFKKRRSIQSKTSGKTKERLLSKYSKREKRRVDVILHKASNMIAKIVDEEKVIPVMERLKDIRKRIKYGRRMNRRLHNMPFRKIQTYISYKSMEYGFEREFVKAKNTSKKCPICGGLSKPNGHVFKCKKCDFKADRHLVAAWNIANKLQMCRPLPLAAKALYEPLIIEVRGKG